MRRSSVCLAILLLVCAFFPVVPSTVSSASAAEAPGAVKLAANVEWVESFRGLDRYRLKSNGMPILLLPDHATPVFTFMVVYRVGSRNEAPGHTGSAHLLEHMIFNKSTENFGRAHGHPTFQEVLYAAGADAGSTNMTTWYDRMNGFSTLPSDKLELAMTIEADRMSRGLILDSERQAEMSVVRNEYEIGENNPFEALNKAVIASTIQAHPYHWSTIGYRSDIEGVTTEKLREHYQRFFHPDNAEAILVGDFDPANALALFDREFGALPKSVQPIPQVVTVEPPQQGERRTIIRRPGTVGLVQIAYLRPGATHPDFYALDVLANILSKGVNARLYQALVDRQIAADVFAGNPTLKDPFPLVVGATAAPGKSHQEVEDALKAALDLVSIKGVTAEEVARAQSQIEVEVIRNRDGAYLFTHELGEAVASADWKWFLTYVDRIKDVTAADVQRVAATYLVPDHANVGWFVPTANSKKPAAAAAAAAATSPTATTAAAIRPNPAANPSASTPAGVDTLTVSSPTPAPTPVVAQETKATLFGERTVHKVFPNGLTLDVLENHSNPTVAIRGSVFAGDAGAPTERRTVPGLVAEMLKRGTTLRTKEQIGALLDGAGATRSYTSGTPEVVLSLNGLSRDLPLLLDVLSDELRQPAFKPDELSKAKAELKTTILRNDDNIQIRALDRLGQLVYPVGHPYRPPGTAALLASLEAATIDDLQLYHHEHYSGANLILAIVGDVDATKVIAAVEKSLGSLPTGRRQVVEAAAVTPAATSTREAITLRGKANMNIALGTASRLRRTDPDYEAALIGNAALGQSSLASRLGKRVRDTEGLSYSVASRYLLTDALDGYWLALVNVAPQNLNKALKSTQEVIAQFAREGITDEEVETQKSFFAANFQVGLGTNAGVASALVTAEKFGFGPTYLDDYPKRFRTVTKDQVNAAIKQHLFADRLHLLVAGDLEKLPE